MIGSSGRSRESRSAVRDPVDDVLPRRDLPEHRVLAVEPRRRLGGDDEELRAVRVRPSVRHRERAALDLVLVELVLERVAGVACAGAERAAALDHEVRDHAVEDEPVVEAVAGELREVLDRLRRVVGVELELDVALARVQDRAGSSPATLAPAAGWPRHLFRTQCQQLAETSVRSLTGWRPRRRTSAASSRASSRPSSPASGAASRAPRLSWR